MRKFVLFAIPMLAALYSMAQESADNDRNVVISKSKKTFEFVKGDKDHPVQVKEESDRIFTCNNYRTDISVVEFYSDIETIDDLDIYVNDSKKHGIVPKYEYYNSDGIFYSDAHVCYFQLPLLKKGSTSEVRFKKTTLDPNYFTNIYFMDAQEIDEQEIQVIVPAWMQVEIKEFNFGNYNIKKNISKDGDETTYTYTMSHLPAMRNEHSAPGPTFYIPHILVMSKSAQPKDEKYDYFKTVKEQYDWYRKLVLQVSVDAAFIKEKTEEIVKGSSSDEEKVKKVFQWVQDNVRYIAFENGIAGFRPEKPQEVIRKKYGDCKGMANLLTEMLRSINLDARRCWIGTNHIAYDYSTPSLAVDNHMICAWMNKGKPIYLDATEKYIGFGEIAERIQGRQTLMENGNGYLLEKVPVNSYAQNASTETRRFSIENNSMKGHVTQVWKGENKVWLLSALNDIKQDKQENALKQFLAEKKLNYEISNLKVTNLSNYNADLQVEYDVLWKDVVTAFDKELYLDADNRRNLENYNIDTAKRKQAYRFPFKNDLLFETEILLPAGKVVNSLPEKLAIQQPGYSFLASYSQQGNKIIYKNEIILKQTEISPSGFSQWNKDIEQLNNFYNQQIVLKQQN